jgi:hypothetical protein
MKGVFSCLAISVVICFDAFGQDMLGISGSNFSGIHGIGSNPSVMTGTKLFMDYNLLSFNHSVGNDYAYWTGSDLRNFLRSGSLPQYFTVADEERNLTIFRKQSEKYGFLSNKVTGPSGMLVHGKHAFALTTSFRSLASFSNLTYDMSIFMYEGLDYRPLQETNFRHDEKASFATLQWFEAGLSYAYNFHRYRWKSWSAGITIKQLLGVSSTYVFLDQVDYVVHNDDSLSVYSTDFRYGYSVPLDYETNDFIWPPIFKGSGFSVDVGLTFWRTKVGHSSMAFSSICEPRFERYRYKIGISLLDLGYIRFSKETEAFTFTDAHTEYYDPWDTLPQETVNQINTKVEYYFPSSVFEPREENEFVMNLPTVLSIQGDYHIEDAWYINSMVVQPIALSKNSIFRPSLLSVAVRYETPIMEIGFPVTIMAWDFTKPNIGVGFRYENFFIGSDNLIPMTTLVNFTGFNIYAGVRLNLSRALRMYYLKGLCAPSWNRNIEIFDYRNF